MKSARRSVAESYEREEYLRFSGFDAAGAWRDQDRLWVNLSISRPEEGACGLDGARRTE